MASRSIRRVDLSQHILVSVQRVPIAFTLRDGARRADRPVSAGRGLFKDYLFPLFEIIRPIPISAWVPLAIIMFPGRELP